MASISIQAEFNHPEIITQLDKSYGVRNKVYIVANEFGRGQTQETLAKTDQVKNGFHIGFSTTENFNFLLTRHSVGAIIADISDNAYEFQELAKKIILESDTPEEFLTKIEQDRRASPEKYCNFNQRSIDTEKAFPHSWLHNRENFQKIRSYYQEGRIFHLHLSVTDVERFKAINTWMKLNNLALDTLYLANIADWFWDIGDDERPSLEQMKLAIAEVINQQTLIVDASSTFPRHPGQCGLTQAVFTGLSTYDPHQSRQDAYLTNPR